MLMSISALAVLSPLASVQGPVRPAIEFAEPFSRVRAVHELGRDSLLIVDQTENALYLVDLTGGSRTRVGRTGAGPGEYENPTGLLPLGGDSFWLLDLGNGRLNLYRGPGNYIRSVPIFRGEGFSIPEGSDSLGNIYWDRSTAVRIAKREGNPGAELAPIVRFSPRERMDTVAYIRIPGPANPGPFPPWDEWGVAPDGAVAIARNTERRVDWVLPDGETVTGTPLEEDPIPVTVRDRQTLMDSTGGRRAGVSVSGRRAARRPADPEFPDEFPAFRTFHLWASGELVWVRRYTHLQDTGPRLDAFDRSGRQVASVVLPPGRVVGGVGQDRIYALRVDEVGLQWLEVYDLVEGGDDGRIVELR